RQLLRRACSRRWRSRSAVSTPHMPTPPAPGFAGHAPPQPPRPGTPPPRSSTTGRHAMGPVRMTRTGPIRGERLLVFLLPLFGSLGASARRLGGSFLLRGLALSVGLILLRLALFGEVVAAGHTAGSFLDLALDALYDALDAFFRSAVAIPHGSSLFASSYRGLSVRPDPAKSADQLALGLSR